jgi:aerobic carbon-monoxide dehydrogenase medium subunit
MKFPPFAYRTPSSLDEAVDQLGSDPGAKILAGGQSLLPLLALRLAHPSVLVDVGGISELSGIGNDGGTIRIGAGTTLSAVEDSQVVADSLPLLAQAIRFVAHRPIRNRGTVGGSLAHADPAAELPAVAVALDVVLVARSPRGERRIAAADFFTGAFSTTLADDEILVAVEFAAGNGSWSFTEVVRRAGDFALGIAAVGIGLDGGTCRWAKIVLGGIGSRPVRVPEAEGELEGRRIDEAALKAAADAAAAAASPMGDIHGSADYRRRLVGVLVRRATLAAAGRTE